MTRGEALKNLKVIPGVGPATAADLVKIGIRKVSDLKGKDPQRLFDRSNRMAGMVQDRCVLYVYRCAVYYASTPEGRRDPGKLLWWNWKDPRG